MPASVATETAQENSGKRIVLLVAALLLLPVLVASALYFSGWRPAQTGNHGELLQPPRALPADAFVDRQGKLIPSANLRDKWIMLFVGGTTCNDDCRAQARLMRQVQVAQNKEMGRIRRVVMAPDADALAAFAMEDSDELRAPDLLLLRPTLALSALLADSTNRIVLIDPLGNAMMRYSAAQDGKGMNKDLERLLKYSWAG
jgi:hypothetical protein